MGSLSEHLTSYKIRLLSSIYPESPIFLRNQFHYNVILMHFGENTLKKKS